MRSFSMLVRIDRTHRFFDGPRNVDFRTKRRWTGSPPPLSPRPLSISTASQELVLEAGERQRVRNDAREPRCGWFRVPKRCRQASEEGRISEPAVLSETRKARTLFSAGSSEICPYRGLRIPRIYSKFLAQVTECQVLVTLASGV